MEKYVYVIWDSHYERVVCVHSHPDMTCEDCDKFRVNSSHCLLHSKKCKVQRTKQEIRDEKINNINGNK